MTGPEDRDGRYVDRDLGVLEGEGAQQRVDPHRPSPVAPVWTQQLPADRSPTYYERPVLKEPVWIWAVPAYFHVGGAAGAAAVLGAAAQAGGREQLPGLVRNCRRLALSSVLVGTGLLILDLGRPARFLNMLRVFRPTSPMSVGSWVLAGSAPLAALSVLTSDAAGSRRRIGDAAGLGLGVLGLPLAGYTAVLVANSAVPVWHTTGRSLPFLFLASSASTASAALAIMDLSERESRIAARFGTVADIAELVATVAVEREAAKVERVGRALKHGLAGTLWKTSTACTLGTLALAALPRRGRVTRWITALLGTGGSLALRFAVFHAGKASARDPRATFEGQRNDSRD
jgi:formate-dependent nitrite reductase membrane component NrfD